MDVSRGRDPVVVGAYGRALETPALVLFETFDENLDERALPST